MMMPTISYVPGQWGRVAVLTYQCGDRAQHS